MIALRSRLLWLADRVFPPNPNAFYAAADARAHYERDKASESMGWYLQQVASRDIDVLDFGCGNGGETLWLATQVRSVAGFDVSSQSIEQARLDLRAAGLANCRFETSSNGLLPFADNSFDCVFSTDTFEHVMDVGAAFAEIKRVLRPGGTLLSRFGPLFYSPYGYHLSWACQVPWAHLWCGLHAILELRKARSGSEYRVQSWEETGLNRKRFDEFRCSAVHAGLEIVEFRPIGVKGITGLTRIPWLRDLFISAVECDVRKPAHPLGGVARL